VVTHLAQFDRRARFSTWAWRIALNACFDARGPSYRLPVLSEEAFAADLADGLDPDAPERPENATLLAKVKIGCGIAMLMGNAAVRLTGQSSVIRLTGISSVI
jgi:DNA-directed RNA polymerase specialized sigma24 family protein